MTKAIFAYGYDLSLISWKYGDVPGWFTAQNFLGSARIRLAHHIESGIERSDLTPYARRTIRRYRHSVSIIKYHSDARPRYVISYGDIYESSVEATYTAHNLSDRPIGYDHGFRWAFDTLDLELPDYLPGWLLMSYES